jgi:hypothetical protein
VVNIPLLSCTVMGRSVLLPLPAGRLWSNSFGPPAIASLPSVPRMACVWLRLSVCLTSLKVRGTLANTFWARWKSFAVVSVTPFTTVTQTSIEGFSRSCVAHSAQGAVRAGVRERRRPAAIARPRRSALILASRDAL